MFGILSKSPAIPLHALPRALGITLADAIGFLLLDGFTQCERNVMQNTDDYAEKFLREAIQSVDLYYKERGIFQDRFGFGKSPAIVVIDFAYGWTDDRYAGGSKRLDGQIENTRQLLRVVRLHQIPIIYTTSPHRPDGSDQPFKSAADFSSIYREWDERACQIDERVAPEARDLIIEKDNASAFFGTHLAGYLIHHRIDRLLITGCSTSACIRATATDAKRFRLRPIVIRECVGDRCAVAHVWTLFDIRSRFADVVSIEESMDYLGDK